MFKKATSCILSAAILIASAVPAIGYDIGTYSYDSASPLLAASKFHMFIKGDAELNAHCLGNVAIGNLVSVNSSFGQLKEEGKSANYIKKLSTNIGITFYGDPFVFGAGTTLEKTDNGNKIKAYNNGYSTQEMLISDCNMQVESADDAYIDFDKEFDALRSLSNELVKSTGGSVVSKFGMNKSDCLIKAEADGVNVLNINYKEDILKSQCQDSIPVFCDTKKSTLIVNIDMAGLGDNVSLNFSTKFNDEGNSERTDIENSKILYNFYDSSSENGAYKGTLNFNKEWVGSILATDAKVILNQNFDGTLVADSVITRGESHSWYFTGDTPNKITTTSNTTTTSKTTTTTSKTTTTTSKTTTTTSKTTTTTAKTTTTSKATTTTSKITTTTPVVTTTTPVVTTTTPVVTTTTPAVSTTTPAAKTTTKSTTVKKRVLAYTTTVTSADKPINKKVLSYTEEEIPDTGSHDGGLIPVFAGSVFIALGVYGTVHRRRHLKFKK